MVKCAQLVVVVITLLTVTLLLNLNNKFDSLIAHGYAQGFVLHTNRLLAREYISSYFIADFEIHDGLFAA